MADPGIEVVAGVEGLTSAHGPLFAVIGVFDGLHRGHQYLLGRLVTEARGRAARSAVITFDSHPDEVLVGAAPPLLLDQDERIRLLGEAGVEVVVVQHFDAALRMTEYDAFVHRISSRAALAGILMTPDAAFGHDRRGTPDTVAALGAAEGFDVVVAPPFTIEGRSVRSSDIRAAIADGNFGRAEELLGRPYAVVGTPGRDGTLDLKMPVACPPTGSYEVIVDEKPASIVIDDTGIHLEPSPAWVPETFVRIEFSAA